MAKWKCHFLSVSANAVPRRLVLVILATADNQQEPDLENACASERDENKATEHGIRKFKLA